MMIYRTLQYMMKYINLFFDWIKNFYKNFYFIALFLLGVLLVYLNSFFKDETLELVAKAILTSGVFTTALKSFQFTGIFKEELGKVISSNEFLNNLKEDRLLKVWNSTTEIICERRFPEISDKLFEFVRDNYLTKGLDYYYPDIQLTIELDYYKNDEKYVLSKESSVIKLKAEDKNSISYKFGGTFDKVSGLNVDEHYKLKELSINGKAYAIQPEIIEHDTDKHKYQVYEEIPLSGSLEYKIIKVETRVEALKTNSDFLSYKIGRLTEKMQFNVKNNTKLRLEYVPFGTISEFETDSETKKLHGYDISKRCTEFVMIGQGFVILLKE